MKKNDKTKQARKPARHDGKQRPENKRKEGNTGRKRRLENKREKGITGRKKRSGNPATKGAMFPEILDNIGISYFELLSSDHHITRTTRRTQMQAKVGCGAHRRPERSHMLLGLFHTEWAGGGLDIQP